jgi:hypothetical protein
MGTVATGGSRRRLALAWAVAVAALVVSLAWGMASQAPRVDGRIRPAASETGSIVIHAGRARGRPHAYHSTTRTRCAKAITLPKRGKVCVDVRQSGSGSRRR